ncbi:transposase [Desulfobulbus rhabdoformis]|uniref:transposase n=1 Tax=Desulfobulbus rhabdoformis TaxID=34032 RepID=UPI0019624191|nr:transposase [Desulfobulbus rhabdoformis]MBM9614159.1 transposase [Desulfobulbus rhabdoformis]
MPRRPRIITPGIPLHIIQRGNNRQACFFADDDYLFYLDWLKEYSKDTGCLVHAYVLMTNHVHLLLTPQEATSAGLLMKRLGQRYVQYINRTYQRTGTLWEGRFRSCVTEEDNYLLLCQRYIEMNPVRAQMVSTPSEYPWSSFQTNGLGEKNEIITPHTVYQALGENTEIRQQAYRELFRYELDPGVLEEIRRATNGNFALGSNRFNEQIAKVLGKRVTPGKAGRPRKERK